MGNQNSSKGNNSDRKSARGSTPRHKRTAADTETEARLQVEEARRRAKEEAEAEEREKQEQKSASRRDDSGGSSSSGGSNRRRRSRGSSKDKKRGDGNKKSRGSKKQQKKQKKRSKGGGSGDDAKKPKSAKKEKIDHVTRKLREDDDTLQAEDLGEIDPLEYGVEWLETVLERMNFDVEVEGKVEDDHFYFDVTGRDAEVLLGVGNNKPRSVEALQTLLSAAIGRYTESRKITLDVGGFRDARSEDLEDVARQIGEMVKRIKKPMTIAGYKSHERRVIHDTLKGDNALATESTGDGIFRKICIKPK
ncbi:MAG: R3H domain-containing nucleic acid-binding protein [Myxococcota bacterium]